MSAQRRQEAQAAPEEALLRELLADANRQLLERDAAVFEILAVREKELARANERLRLVKLDLEHTERELTSVNRALADIQASRTWRLAEHYRRLRDRFKAVLPSRPA